MKFCDIPKEIYFVGIGGVSMSGLATYLHNLGYVVAGSDRQQSETTDKLQQLGIDVHIGESQQINSQLVVRTSAVPPTHSQIVQAQHNGATVILREQLLGAIFDTFQRRIAICGTHGKTTVTALVHHVLNACDVPHTAFVGGECGERCFDGGDVVVAEACEYNRSFLHLNPTHTLCLNIQFDHPDCYKNLAEVQRAFCQLFEQSQKVILPSNLKKLRKKGIFYDQFEARNIKMSESSSTFDLYCKNQFVCACKTKLLGQHNVTNLLAVFCLCHQLGLPLLQVAHAIATFDGVKRRWTEKLFWCRLVCDYAHHPTEINCAIQTAKSITDGKVVCVFQPHTYSRTKAFWQQFASCFSDTTVLYLPIFSARELPQKGVTSQELCKFAQSIGVDAHFATNFDKAKKMLKDILAPNDTLLILGAGNVVELADFLQSP